MSNKKSNFSHLNTAKRSGAPVVWTRADDQAVYDLYLEFFAKQEAGEKYQKAAAVRALAADQGRSKGSIEAKMMNISAIRRDLLQLDIVTGYKALPRYAHQLAEVICAFHGVEYQK